MKQRRINQLKVRAHCANFKMVVRLKKRKRKRTKSKKR